MGTIAVIDYGMGNLHSIGKALQRVTGDRVLITWSPEEIQLADRVVFPGVGGIGSCISEIKRLGLDEALREAALEKPLLSICVGMQALMTHSAESGGTDCLNLVKGQVRRFDSPSKTGGLKVPHMGWNEVWQAAHGDSVHPLWAGINNGERFYFVHSYYVAPEVDTVIQGETAYPMDFAAALSQGNIFAVQFHPEKSAQAGLTLLHNFCQWNGDV